MQQTQQIVVTHQQTAKQIQAVIAHQTKQTRQTRQIQVVTQQVVHQQNQVMPH